MNKVSLPLCIADEPRIASFDFSKRVTVRVSLANPGAEDLANELANSFAGLTVSTAEAADDATHMLLYLNEDTFVSDERLAEQVKQARQDRLKIVTAHENDPALGGCQFSRFFEVTPQERMSQRGACPATPPPQPSPPQTPQELIAGGLYKDLAKSCFPGHHRKARALSPTASSPPHRAFRDEGRVPARRCRSSFWQRA